MNLTIFLFEEIEVFFINFQNNIKKKRKLQSICGIGSKPKSKDQESLVSVLLKILQRKLKGIKLDKEKRM
jgi:hypothetical protein